MATLTLQVEPQETQQEPTLRGRRSLWPEWICLALYCGVVAFMIPFHEPWADEAQAWMLARSLSLWQLFHTYLHYEGSPGLWHLLLWFLVRLHVSYTGMHWVSGAIAACGICVFLFHAPFPRWLKFVVPFSFFLVFQYAVVARNYVLAPLLLFGIAALWRRNPVLVALLLGLLANVSGHCAAISFGFACAYGIELRRKFARRESMPNSRQLWIMGAVLLTLYLAAAATAFPAKDVWVASNQPIPGALPHTATERSITRAILALVSFWDPWQMAAIGWAAVIWGFKRRNSLHLLLPAAAFVLFCGAIYFSTWHEGLLALVLLAALWISWPSRSGKLKWAEVALRTALTVMFAVQAGWAYHAAVYDHFNDYSPDPRTARFLAPIVESGGRAATASLRFADFQAPHTVGLEPYFPQKLYVNQAMPFWWWSTNNRTEADFPAALAAHPQVVLIEFTGTDEQPRFAPSQDLAAPSVLLVERNGYRLTRVFCGAMPLRFGISGQTCHLVFLLDSSPGQRPPG